MGSAGKRGGIDCREQQKPQTARTKAACHNLHNQNGKQKTTQTKTTAQKNRVLEVVVHSNHPSSTTKQKQNNQLAQLFLNMCFPWGKGAELRCTDAETGKR
jgi:hypothetical protein